MATIPDERKNKHRRELEKTGEVVWLKTQADDAIQAVVDLLQSPSSRTAVNNSIEGAVPGVFNVDQKQQIFVRAVDELFEQEK